VNGSSLPNRSGTLFSLNLSVRAFDRWIASLIMSGVAVVEGGFFDAVVKTPADVVVPAF